MIVLSELATRRRTDVETIGGHESDRLAAGIALVHALGHVSTGAYR